MIEMKLRDLVNNLKNGIRTTINYPILRTAEGNYTLFGNCYDHNTEVSFSSALSERDYSELLSIVKAQTMTKEGS